MGKIPYGHLSFTRICVILSCAVGCVVFAMSSVYTKHTFSWLSFWRNWLIDFFSHLSFSQVKLNLLNAETNGYCIGQLCFTELLI